MQAETLASAYRLWRRNWKGRGKEYTAGALVWQVRSRLARGIALGYPARHVHAHTRIHIADYVHT